MLRPRHLSFTPEPLDTAHDGSTNKISRIRVNPHNKLCETQMKDEALDQRCLIDIYCKDGYVNHRFNRSTLCDEVGQRAVIENKGYVNHGIKRRSLSEDAARRTVMQDTNGYVNHGVKRRNLCQDVDWETVTDCKDNCGFEFSKEDRILRESGGGDLRGELVACNPKRDNFRGDFNKVLSSESLQVYSRFPQQSGFRADYDAGFSSKSLHAHARRTCDSEKALAGGYKVDSLGLASKSTQAHQISAKRLEGGSVLHKKWINNQEFGNDYDSIANCESYNSCKQSSSKLNDCYVEETSDTVPGDKLPGLIFMCNNKIRKNCFHYGVFGMPLSKVKLLDYVKPGTKLFLFEYESRQLWGIYEATSYPGRELENEAFKGSEIDFPLQVRFSVYKSCEPLPERQFKQAINENYFCLSKFKFDLSAEQVSRLIRLFCSRDILSKHISKSLSQTSVSKDSLHDWRYHEPGRLTDSRFGKDGFWERDTGGQTRRELLTENIKNTSNFQRSAVTRGSKLDQNYHISGRLSEDLEFEDDIAGRMDVIGSSRINDPHFSDREHMIKDSSQLSKPWANNKRVFKGEEVMSSDTNAVHVRNAQPCGWGRHICDNTMDDCGNAMYSDLKGKDSSAGKCDILKPFPTKGSVPPNGYLPERDGRIEKLLQHETSHGKVAAPFANLANPEKKGQLLANSSRLRTGQVNGRYNVQIASKEAAEQSDDFRRQYETAAICSNIGVTAHLGRSVLDSAYLETQRAKNGRQNLVVANHEKGINPMIAPNHESRKFWEASFNDGTRGMAAVTRSLLAVGNKDVGLSSTRVLDGSESIRIALKNDAAWMDALQDGEGMHALDGDEGIHLQQNKPGSVRKLIPPLVGISRTFPKKLVKIRNSRRSTLDEQSLSRSESTERTLQKKPTVWDRLSGRVSTTYSSMKTRSLHMEQMSEGDENDSEIDESDAPNGEGCYTPNEVDDIEVDDIEVDDIEDTAREDFVIDFKRRKNIRGSQEQTEETTAKEISKSNFAPQEENSLQNNSDAQKKRRRLIRPQIISSDAKNAVAGNRMEDREHCILISSKNENSANAENTDPMAVSVQSNVDTQASEPDKVPCL